MDKINASSAMWLLRCAQCTNGVGSKHALWGPQIQVVGVALITEICDPTNIHFLKVVF